MGNTDSQTKTYNDAVSHYRKAQLSSCSSEQKYTHLTTALGKVNFCLSYPAESATTTSTLEKLEEKIYTKIAALEEEKRIGLPFDVELSTYSVVGGLNDGEALKMQQAADEKMARQLHAEELENRKQFDIQEKNRKLVVAFQREADAAEKEMRRLQQVMDEKVARKLHVEELEARRRFDVEEKRKKFGTMKLDGKNAVESVGDTWVVGEEWSAKKV